ncbi:MAG: AbrB/MazE/SpoVT family DNA-binding domain-containing protein [Alphaproteobacteria bacterium]|nr:MAG: AbrB/MazE/SpoVT family DNA-binding domain-containing protein [Alphaproteobacteria bacterium]
MLSKDDMKTAGFNTRLRKTGSAVGATIPAEFLRDLNMQEGDQVTVSIEENGVKIVKSDPEFETNMTHYDVIEDRFAPAFRKLAE